jgi:hypothetical protein
LHQVGYSFTLDSGSLIFGVRYCKVKGKILSSVKFDLEG